MEHPLTLSKFGCTRPWVACSVGVGWSTQTRAGLSFEKSFLVQPWSSISHQRNILALTFYWVSPLLTLNMEFFNPRGWWKTPLTLSNSAGLAFSRVGCLLCWSWMIYTNAFRIELSKKLSCTTLIRYQSPEEYSGLGLSLGDWVSPAFS